MNYCRPHNRFYPERLPSCPKCEQRVIEEATSLPYRVTNPQEHARHLDRDGKGCGNLLPVCKCDLSGSIRFDRPPALYSPNPPYPWGPSGTDYIDPWKKDA